jgi:hypothetical protein
MRAKQTLIYIYTHIYTFTYIHTHIHTHTHISVMRAKQTLIEAYLAKRSNPSSLDNKSMTKLTQSARTSNAQLLASCLHELSAIGVLDGTATAEPILYYCEQACAVC